MTYIDYGYVYFNKTIFLIFKLYLLNSLKYKMGGLRLKNVSPQGTP